MSVRVDRKYHFKVFFDKNSGTYVRSGIIQDNVETDVNPFRATFPHLIDIGIMGYCNHGISGLCESAGIGCYQDGRNKFTDNMTLNDFKRIALECKSKVDQFALGGRGDPDEHEDFEEILKICNENGIVPNYTTSGFNFSKQKAEISKKYCGSVAVSWYRNSYTLNTIELLLSEKIKTNIHYVLGKNTIDEAIDRITNHTFPEVNSIIFLLHKPQGQGKVENVLDSKDPRVPIFFDLISSNKTYRFGIDSCMVPGMINFGNNFDINSLDTCEAGRFSCYISADMKMVPCSFDTQGLYEIDLRGFSIQDAFDSDTFELFRSKMMKNCRSCKMRSDCFGGCSIMPSIVLCSRRQETQ